MQYDLTLEQEIIMLFKDICKDQGKKSFQAHLWLKKEHLQDYYSAE